MKRRNTMWGSWALALGLAVVGCGEPQQPVEELQVPSTYEFPSRFTEGSSVKYLGQSLRHVLIADMKSYVVGLTGRLGTASVSAGQVRNELEFFYNFSVSTSGDVAPRLTSSAPLLAAAYKDIAPGGANLTSKIAGKDPVGQHQDWSQRFVGWTGAGSPEALVRSWFNRLDELAVARAQGNVPRDPLGNPIAKVQVTPEGLDLEQLVQKFLDMSVGFSQAADDYLDDDMQGEGLLVDNTAQVGTEPYTQLEHHWDEAFGYLGASRDLGPRPLQEVLSKPGQDSNGDGKIDVRSEHNFTIAVYAVRRDAESAPSAKTRFTADLMESFLRGRAIITAAKGPLSAEQLAELRKERDRAISTWEKVVAASVVSYLNDVLQHMENFDTTRYNFADHAKHWSEMKGLALGFQFNPRSPLSDDKFAELHARLGQAPVLPNQSAQAIAEYRQALLAAREILRVAYQFDPANMGDTSGRNGW